MAKEQAATDSLAEATRSRAKFSGHGSAKGAAGFRVESEGGESEFLSQSGQTAIINPKDGGFGKITIGAAWDMMEVSETNPLVKLFKKTKLMDVDLDLGCLYEMKDGKRGAIQAFGELYGAFEEPPYVSHSGDEREGDEEGDDEYIMIDGRKWPEIKRLVLYVYIYDGAPHWESVKPQIQVRVPGETPMIVTLAVGRSELPVCAVAEIENVRNGIKLINHTEYFPGHAEMDRAFGFGIEWDDGKKRPQSQS